MNPGHQTKINAERNDETILRQHLIGEKLLAPLPAAPLRARVKTCTTVRQVPQTFRSTRSVGGRIHADRATEQAEMG